MEEAGVVDERRAPFCWIDMRAFAVFDGEVNPEERLRLIGFYTTLTRMASDRRDAAHEGFVASVGEVAAAAGIGVRTAQRHLSRLVELRLLRKDERVDSRGGRLSSAWVLVSPQRGASRATGGDTRDGGGGDSRGVVAVTPNARGGSSAKKEERLSADAERRTRANTTYRGRLVPRPIVEAAEHALSVFCEATGRKIGPWSGDGSPSPALRQIIGAMLARPAVEPDAWEAAVRNTVANPPGWIGGQVQIGHVFGERAAEWALANQGRVREARDAEKQERVDQFMDALAKFTTTEAA